MPPANSRSSRGRSSTSAQDDEPRRRIKELLRTNGVRLIEGREGRIGTGTHSHVYKATMSSRNNEQVAVKLVDLRRRGEYIERFMPRELAIIPRLDHVNIVAAYAIHRTKEYVAIVEEYAPGGDLLNYIRTKPDRYLEEREAKPILRQLMDAIVYLERLHIVHRDIKCENIFLDSNLRVKLGDFGFARELRPGVDSNTHCGSRPYAAIELLSGRTYRGNGVDIWSAGVVLYVILTSFFPFGSSKDEVPAIIKRQKAQSIHFSHRLSAEVRSLILGMLHPDPKRRLTSRRILAHPWLAETYRMIRIRQTRFIHSPNQN
uniref:Protein kinase domain-containing protein n=2 Tax=Meloidogyne TaxID=189290 RepID=A0A914KND5_MELIC